MDIRSHEIRGIAITPEILKLIAEIDEFKGRWKVMESLAPEKLTTLRRIATIESFGSSTRIEGAKLSDREVEKLLSGVKAKSFASRDEQEVAGYADAMDMVFESFESISNRLAQRPFKAHWFVVKQQVVRNQITGPLRLLAARLTGR